jgi:hypothetical protein
LASQKDRRNTLFHTIRSCIRLVWTVTCVFFRVSRNGSACAQPCQARAVLNRMTLPAAMSEPVSSREPTSSSYADRATMSSLSAKVMYSPVACAVPVFRAGPSPWFGWWTSLKRGSLSAYAFAITVLPSGEPSSTMMTSRSRMVCLAMDSRQASIYGSTL